MSGLIKRFYRRSFVRNVAILTSGTAIAQILTVMVTPLLSRLYDPTAFGILGVALALAAPFVAIASLKYERAIVFCREDDEAAGLFAISVALCSGFTLVAALAVFGSREWLAVQFDSPSASDFLLIVPLIIFLNGLFAAFSAHMDRYKRYREMSRAIMVHSGGANAGQIAFGVLNSGSMGLIIGRVLGRFLAILMLLRGGHILADLRLGFGHGLTKLRCIARDHKKFPVYAAPRVFLRTTSDQMPAFLLALFFGPAIAGLYWFAARLIDMPTTLVGNSVSRVFYQQASDKFWKRENLLPIWIRSTASLAVIASPPVAILVVLGPDLFEFVFGPQWRESGVYAQWLVFWWLSRFVSIPSAALIPIYDLQGFFLIYEIFAITVRLGVIFLAAFLSDAILAIALYSIVGIALNVFLLLFVFRYVRRPPSAHG